jgi:nucleotide-binding universal stress UspA family protein
MYRKILVATDGSPTSDRALAELDRLVGPSTDVLALAVVEFPSTTLAASYSAAYDLNTLWQVMREQGEAVLKHTQEQLDMFNIPATLKLVDLCGHPETDVASAIETEADTWGADLIVLGTHGRRGFRRLMLGSVAEQVVRLSKHPVLLVRAGDGN